MRISVPVVDVVGNPSVLAIGDGERFHGLKGQREQKIHVVVVPTSPAEPELTRVGSPYCWRTSALVMPTRNARDSVFEAVVEQPAKRAAPVSRGGIS